MSARSTVRIAHAITEVERAAWDALTAQASPFLEWDWLASLEESGCVSARKGWAPHHVLVEEDGRLVAACPLYLKSHSEGEFVFDWEWAHASESAGVPYYPKMLVAVPFTPATGQRFLTAPDVHRPTMLRLLGQVLVQVCDQNELAGVHVNFCLEDEAEALAELGYLRRTGLQYHWRNHGYATFEDYLAQFRSKRRTKIRREVKEMDRQGLRIRALHGEDGPAAIPPELPGTMYELYERHITKLYWGRLYLNARFFELLGQRYRRNLCFVVAEEDGRVLAGTTNIQKNGVFYGRYWGAFEERHHLHFNVCYYAAIRHCIEQGIQVFEPGAGGEFKHLRGFDPALTTSMHYLRHPGLREAVEDFLLRERRHRERARDHLTEHSKLRATREAYEQEVLGDLAAQDAAPQDFAAQAGRDEAEQEAIARGDLPAPDAGDERGE